MQETSPTNTAGTRNFSNVLGAMTWRLAKTIMNVAKKRAKGITQRNGAEATSVDTNEVTATNNAEGIAAKPI